jgi:hypothetical protein
VLRKIFELKKGKIKGRRKLHNEDLHNFYSWPNIIRIIKSRSMRWAGNAALMGENKNAYRVLVGTPDGKRLLEDLDVGGMIILKCI